MSSSPTSRKREKRRLMGLSHNSRHFQTRPKKTMTVKRDPFTFFVCVCLCGPNVFFLSFNILAFWCGSLDRSPLFPFSSLADALSWMCFSVSLIAFWLCPPSPSPSPVLVFCPSLSPCYRLGSILSRNPVMLHPPVRVMENTGMSFPLKNDASSLSLFLLICVLIKVCSLYVCFV